MALTKLLENTLDESLKIKNMSDGRLGCLIEITLKSQFLRDNAWHFRNFYFIPWYFLTKCTDTLNRESLSSLDLKQSWGEIGWKKKTQTNKQTNKQTK